MKGRTAPATVYLRPILDTYMGSAVALVGCTSRGIERYSCEMDVLVVTSERQPTKSIKLGDSCADVVFATEKDILKPASAERAMSIAQAKPIRDSALVISTGSAAAAATFSDSARGASRTRLTSALKTAARAEEALAKGSVTEADYWLLAASYEFAYALLLSRETIPSPSHLLSQLRSVSKGASKGFEVFSRGAGLDASTRAGCGTRLEGVAVLHDLLREGSDSATADSEWSETRTGILGAKAKELITRVELAECYSFLGQELIDAVAAIQKPHPGRTLGSLTTGGDKLLGDRILKQLGLSRGSASIRSGLGLLRDQVVLLARKV
jgi:hypothetical protein